MNAAPVNEDNTKKPTLNPNDVDRLNENLNLWILKDEIHKGIKNLKNDTAFGDDSIINEYIKSTSGLFIEFYKKLFNVIFFTGIILDSWLIGYIKPVYKKR